jgi:hypothetical protein
MGPDDFLGFSNGPVIVDYELQAPPSNATADPNGCAASYTNATAVVRLIYASGVRERNLTDATGAAPLSPLGAAADAARANSMFTVASSALGLFGSGDRCAQLQLYNTTTCLSKAEKHRKARPQIAEHQKLSACNQNHSNGATAPSRKSFPSLLARLR